MTSWGDKTACLEQRLVRDVETVRFRSAPRQESGVGETFFNDGAGLVLDPLCEAGADGSRPALLLAARRRQRFVAGAGNQIRRKRPDIVCDVDVFREPATHAPDLRQRRAALEGQVFCERGLEQDAERRDDPDVLLQQMCLVAAASLRYFESVAPVVGQEILESRLRHAQCGCSPAPPSRWA